MEKIDQESYEKQKLMKDKHVQFEIEQEKLSKIEEEQQIMEYAKKIEETIGNNEEFEYTNYLINNINRM